MKTLGLWVLTALLSMAGHGGIPDAASAATPPQPRVPAPRAAAPPAPDLPAGGGVPGAPGGGPQNPDAAPMPAPAPTDHYTGPAKYTAGMVISR